MGKQDEINQSFHRRLQKLEQGSDMVTEDSTPPQSDLKSPKGSPFTDILKTLQAKTVVAEPKDSYMTYIEEADQAIKAAIESALGHAGDIYSKYPDTIGEEYWCTLHGSPDDRIADGCHCEYIQELRGKLGLYRDYREIGKELKPGTLGTEENKNHE